MRFFKVICFFLLIQTLHAQYVDTKVLTANNGLISNNIQSCLVDSNGNLWLGSRAGLSVKYGNSFKNVPQAAKYKFNNIFDIIEDPAKNKWIAGYGQGILFIGTKFSRLINSHVGLVNNNVRALFYYNDKIYAGTSNGISIISQTDFSVVNPKFNQHPEYFFNVTSFFSVNNKVYATVLNDGIFEVTPDTLIKVSNLKKSFSSHVFQERLYVGTQNDLYELHTSNFKIIKKFNISNVSNFLKAGDELYFISAGIFENKGGLFKMNNNEVINCCATFNLPFTDLKGLAFDAENNYMYVGTYNNGLVQINCNAAVYHQKDLNEVFLINVDETNQYVFHNRGFSIFSNNSEIKRLSLQKFKDFQLKNDSKYKKTAVIKNHFYPLDYETSADKIIFYSSQIYKNHLWVASNIGMFKLNLSGTILSYHPVHVYNFTFFNDELITPVPHAGVRVFRDIHTMDYSYAHDWKNPQVPTEIVSIAQTENAVYFASALSGLYEYKNGRFRSLMLEKSFVEPKIKRICATSTGELVAVTDYNDVYVLNVSQPKVRVVKHIPHPKIKGSTTNFAKEIKGALYIATNLGLNVFKGNRYFFVDQEQGFTNYNTATAAVTSKHLYAATKHGYFVLNNDYFITERSLTDAAVISSIYVNNQLQPQFNNGATELTLKYNENNIRLNFSVENAKYPNKLQFQYRLKQSEAWQDLTTDSQLQLNYLDNGLYQLQLKITNLDTGNRSIQTLKILNIQPPFYYTLPFLVAVSLVISGIAYGGYRVRINYLKQKQAQKLAVIELQNQQEKKELLFDKQLADVKLQALKSQMNSHFLFNVLSSIQYFIICKDVDNALYYLERFSALVRTTLEYSDKKFISMYDEIAYLKQYVEIENLRAEHAIVLTENIAEEIDVTEINIVPLLLQPFIENAIVHAFPPSIKNPEIKLKIERENQSFKITITDNGIGYQQKSATAHQSKGIAIVQARLDLTQKKLQKPIEINTSEKGTQVVIIL